MSRPGSLQAYEKFVVYYLADAPRNDITKGFFVIAREAKQSKCITDSPKIARFLSSRISPPCPFFHHGNEKKPGDKPSYVGKPCYTSRFPGSKLSNPA